MWRGCGEVLPDELEHEELVEIGVEQGARDGIHLPVMVMRAPGEIDNHDEFTLNEMRRRREARSSAWILRGWLKSVAQLQHIHRVGRESLRELRARDGKFATTGTTASGCVMLLVALGVLPLIVVSVACGASLPTPVKSIGEGLRGRSRVDDFDEELVRCIVARDGGEDARGRIGERRWHDFGSEMRREHDLRPVAGRAVTR